MHPNDWENVFSKIERRGMIIDKDILMDNFQDVVNKAFDQDMGFGYIAENGYKPDGRVILQGKNPFVDNHTVSNDCVGICATPVAGVAEHGDERISSLQSGLSPGWGWGDHSLYLQVRLLSISMISIRDAGTSCTAPVLVRRRGRVSRLLSVGWIVLTTMSFKKKGMNQLRNRRR